MKRKFTLSVLLVAFLALFAMDTKAQDFYSQSYASRNSGSFSKSTSLLSIQYGFGDQLGYSYGYVGPFYLRYEQAVLDELGLSAYVAPGFGFSSNYSRFDLAFGAIAYYHFNKFIPVEQLDVFLGAGIAFLTGNSSTSDKFHFNTRPAFKGGARWYFNPKVAGVVEFGYDASSYTQIGVTFRF